MEQIKWHPVSVVNDVWCGEVPDTNRDILVTTEDGYVRADFFDIDYNFFYTYDIHVIAWAEFPKPYKTGSET